MLPWYTHLGIKFTLAPFSILGVAIAIFLGFRNNAGYARYVEARKLWGQLMIASRSLLQTRKCQQYLSVLLEGILLFQHLMVARKKMLLFALGQIL